MLESLQCEREVWNCGIKRENLDLSIDTNLSEDVQGEDEGKEEEDEEDDSATMSTIEMRVCIHVAYSCPCYLGPLLSKEPQKCWC